MKKITLSAAILALTMMACSDAGLDNSVASANEVKNTHDQAFLAKVNNWPRNPYIDQIPFQPVTGSLNQIYRSYGDGVGIQIHAGTKIDPGSNGGEAWFTKLQGLNDPDYVRFLILPLYDCSLKNNNTKASCAISSYTNMKVAYGEYKSLGNNQSKYTAFTDPDKDLIFHPSHPTPHYYNKMNVITYYIAVWNEGKWNQVILAGTIYNGQQFKNNPLLAEKAYSQIFLPAIDALTGSH